LASIQGGRCKEREKDGNDLGNKGKRHFLHLSSCLQYGDHQAYQETYPKQWGRQQKCKFYGFTRYTDNKFRRHTSPLSSKTPYH